MSILANIYCWCKGSGWSDRSGQKIMTGTAGPGRLVRPVIAGCR